MSDPAEPMAEADRGRHPGFPSFNLLAGGPRSLAEPGSSKKLASFPRPLDRRSWGVYDSKCFGERAVIGRPAPRNNVTGAVIDSGAGLSNHQLGDQMDSV
jgi:hypothetical protein